MLFTNSEMISQDVKLKFTFLKHQLKTLPNSLVASRAQLQDRNVQNSTGGQRSCGNVVSHSLEKDFHCFYESEDGYCHFSMN